MKPGERIKLFRNKKGLSQEKLAKALGYSQEFVSEIETGEADPPREFLKKLNKVFGISSDYILYGGTAADLEQIVTDLQSIGVDQELIEKVRLRCLAAIYRGGQEEYQRGQKNSLVREPEIRYGFLPTSTKKLLNNIVEILESGNEVMIDALKANVKAFLEAIQTGKKNNEDKGGEIKS
jgi:transcriptional regulator with XRE-family HTH domain